MFFGPIDTYTLSPIAKYTRVWGIPVLTTGGQANGFRDKEAFPLLTTVGGTYSQYAIFFKNLLKKYHWCERRCFTGLGV